MDFEQVLRKASAVCDLQAIEILAVTTTIDDLTAKGTTALTLAVLNNHVACAKRLLQWGANPNLELPIGGCVLDLIRLSENAEMRALPNPT